MNDVTLFGFAHAAQKAEVCEKTLLRYCKCGILQPMRDSAGRRLFTEDDIKVARQYRSTRNNANRVLTTTKP